MRSWHKLHHPEWNTGLCTVCVNDPGDHSRMRLRQAGWRVVECESCPLSTIYAMQQNTIWLGCAAWRKSTMHIHVTVTIHHYAILEPVSWKIKYRICWIADGGDPIWNAKAGAPFLSRPGRVSISQGKPLGMHKQKRYIQPKAS